MAVQAKKTFRKFEEIFAIRPQRIQDFFLERAVPVCRRCFSVFQAVSGQSALVQKKERPPLGRHLSCKGQNLAFRRAFCPQL